jgi:hypothetical protein
MTIKHVYSQTVADGTATSVVRPSDWNSNHNMVQNIGGNTLGTSQVSGTDVVWAGGSNVTLSAAGSTISILAAPQATLSYLEPPVRGNSTSASLNTGSLYFQPFVVPNNLSFYRANMAHQVSSMSASTFPVTASISAAGSNSHYAVYAFYGTAFLYSLLSTGNVSQALSIQSFLSAPHGYTLAMSQSASWSGTNSSQTVSVTTAAAITYGSQYGSNGAVTTGVLSSSGSTSFSSTSSGAQSFSSSFSNGFASSVLSGIRPLIVPMAAYLVPGEYWFANVVSTSATFSTQGASNLATAIQAMLKPTAHGIVGYSSNSSAYLELGHTGPTAVTDFWQKGWGAIAPVSATTGAIAFASIASVSNIQTWLQFVAQTKA